MAKFDLSVTYLKPSSFKLTDASRHYLRSTQFDFPPKFQGKKMTAVLSFGSGSLWLGFNPFDEIEAELLDYVSPDNLLFSVPIALDLGEVLIVDYFDNHFMVTNFDLGRLLQS